MKTKSFPKGYECRKVIAWSFVGLVSPILLCFAVVAMTLFTLMSPIFITAVWVIGVTFDKDIDESLMDHTKFYFTNYVFIWKWKL